MKKMNLMQVAGLLASLPLLYMMYLVGSMEGELHDLEHKFGDSLAAYSKSHDEKGLSRADALADEVLDEYNRLLVSEKSFTKHLLLPRERNFYACRALLLHEMKHDSRKTRFNDNLRGAIREKNVVLVKMLLNREIDERSVVVRVGEFQTIKRFDGWLRDLLEELERDGVKAFEGYQFGRVAWSGWRV